jgi:hypothetical protein
MTRSWICGSVTVAILIFGGVLDATARNEAAVGKCSTAFVGSCGNQESTSREKCEATASAKYQKCMDAAIAAPPSRTGGQHNPTPKGSGGLTPVHQGGATQPVGSNQPSAGSKR